ncbi:MAG: alpha/beta fold hydrolase [Dermatophilus congolensis]|nr:alpha/beta fold hydrolase [Dermatophilus congolensis]
MAATAGRTDPLIRLRTGESTPVWRLVACPPSGAGATFYQPWAADPATADCELYSVRYPGRESRFREPFAASVSTLADEAASAVIHLLGADDLPTAILGHSMGASVAVETVARVEAELPGRVGLLVLSAKADPRPAPPQKVGRLRRLFGGKRDDVGESVEEIIATDASLTTWMRELGGTPQVLLDDPDFMAMQLPIMRADLRMSHRHTTIPDPVAVPLLLLAADADTVTTAESMRGWADISHGTVTERVIPGGHHALLAPETHVPALVRTTLFGG